MPLIQINKFYIKIVLLLLFAIFLTSSCETQADFEQKGPGKQESRRVLVDINVVSSADKTVLEALFYYDISEIVDGKEIRGFGKNVIKVNDAKLAGTQLKETKDEKDRIIYTTEISNEKKEYELSFTVNENLQAKHKLEIDPLYIEDKDIRLKKSEAKEYKLSRKATESELPVIVEIKNEDENFIPASVGYDNKGAIFFNATSLQPFPNGKRDMRITFETNSSKRLSNRSIERFDYTIKREIEIIDQD